MFSRQLSRQLSRAAFAALIAVSMSACASKSPTENDDEERTYDLRPRAARIVPDSAVESLSLRRAPVAAVSLRRGL